MKMLSRLSTLSLAPLLNLPDCTHLICVSHMHLKCQRLLLSMLKSSYNPAMSFSALWFSALCMPTSVKMLSKVVHRTVQMPLLDLTAIEPISNCVTTCMFRDPSANVCRSVMLHSGVPDSICQIRLMC